MTPGNGRDPSLDSGAVAPCDRHLVAVGLTLLVAVAGWLTLVALEAPAENLAGRVRLRAHHEKLARAADERYLVDRARALSGVVFGPRGACQQASIRIHDARSLAGALEPGLTPRQVLSVVAGLAPEQVLASEESGAFAWSPADLGPQWLWISAEGHAPRRMGPFPVRDGLGVAELRCQLVEARQRAVHCDLDDVRRVTPVYAGWWPGDQGWSVSEPLVVLSVPWREPDGWPLALATIDGQGQLALWAWPSSAEGTELPPLSAWEPWLPTPSALGPAARALDPRTALWRSDEPRVQSAGAGPPPLVPLTVSAPTGFGVVEWRRPGAAPRQEFADAFGEWVGRGAAGDRLVVRCLTPFRGWSGSKGVVLPADGEPPLLYFHPQEGETGAPDQVSIVGFVDDPTGVVSDAVVFCQPASWPLGGPVQRTTTDVHGFYRFDGLTAGAAYDLVFVRDERPACVRGQLRATVGTPGGPPHWQDLSLSGASLDVAVPTDLAAGELRLLQDAAGERPRWSVPLDQLADGQLLDVPPGLWRLAVYRDDALQRESAPVTVDRVPGLARVAW